MSKLCEICKANVSTPNWARHLTSGPHLKNWGKLNNIHDYESKSNRELFQLKGKVDGRKSDYSMYNTKKLQEIGKIKGLADVSVLHRGKLLKRLQKATGLEPYKKLHIYTPKKLREIAAHIGISNFENRTQEELIKKVHTRQNRTYCEPCKVGVSDVSLHNESEKHQRRIGGAVQDIVDLSKTRNFQRTVYNNVNEEVVDISPFLDLTRIKVRKQIEQQINKKENLKIFFSLECSYERKRIDDEEEYQFTTMIFHTKAKPFFTGSELDAAINSHFEELKQKESQLHPSQGSGWSLHKAIRLIFNYAKYSPIGGSSYIDLPKWVKNKKACVNIMNLDEKCFVYSVLCGLSEPAIHANRPSQYASKINDKIFQGFDYPMKLSDISKFEKRSQHREEYGYPSIAINVFEVRQETIKKEPEQAIRMDESSSSQTRVMKQPIIKDDIRPILISKHHKASEVEIDLLLLTDEETDKTHYVYIKSLSRLVASQISSSKWKIYLCKRCLSHFYEQKKLDEHEQYCGDNDPCVLKMPYRGSVVKFKNHKNKFEHPYVIYADFETLNTPIELDGGEKMTKNITKHVPYGFALKLVSRVNNEYYEPYVYRATTEDELKNVPKKFMDTLKKGLLNIANKYENPKEMNLTSEEETMFQNSTICHICEGDYKKSDENEKKIKVRDHCHLTGRFMGAAHQGCNLNRSMTTKINVVLHNLSNFDSHLFIEQLFHYNSGSKTLVIANTEEKYITFEKNMFKVKDSDQSKYFKLVFIDSFRFMNSSIEKLASYLERDQMKQLNSFIGSSRIRKYITMDKNRAFQVLRGKGVFPYQYLDSLNKLNTSSLLTREDFKDSLNDSSISDKDYLIYKLVWNKLKNKTLGSYSDLYNIQDVLLLADIFESFRDMCLKYYDLDPVYYPTVPSLAWDAMLKATKCEIGLIHDPTMHLMVEKGIRGGVSQVCKRYVKANNKYLNSYNPELPTNHLLYVDANNLYGWAMSQALPYQDFAWVDPSTHSLNTWLEIVKHYGNHSKKGYILDVDLEYPSMLHAKHKHMPAGACHFKGKLCTTLHDKTNYVLHVKNLKEYLKMGLRLRNINRVVQFTQTTFIQPYVAYNTQRRAESKNVFEKEFFKLMVNAVFGRTMLNLRKRQNITLCNEATTLKLARKPACSRWTMFNKDFFACHMAQNRLYMNQPIQVGFSVLEISKCLMLEFLYDVLMVYDPDLNLVLTDTDSFILELKKDPNNLIEENATLFDTSNYPVDHPLYSTTNKNVPGKFKNELGGQLMTEVCGLRSKLYTYTTDQQAKKITCKGIKRNVAQKILTMNHFKEALFQDKEFRCTQNVIRSIKHELFTTKQSKLALDANDDKRHICYDKVNTLPWGYYTLSDEKCCGEVL